MVLTSLPPDRRALLERPLFAHVAVTAPDGSPRSSPMWFALDDDRLLLTTSSTRPQARWLSPDGGRLALSVIDPDHPYRYAGVAARIDGVTPDPEGEFFYRLARRYGLEVTLSDPSSRVVLHAHPERVWWQ